MNVQKKIKIIAPVLASLLLLTAAGAYAADLRAFPGAEGGGKYTLGARGDSSIEVYHVTNLNANGDGSFADAVSKSGRIIVFDVGGTIELTSQFRIAKDNITILGQTAPGDGITLTGSDAILSSGVKNVIMRYIRIRPTDKNGGEPDGLGGRWNENIIIDHCSVSWSVDETLTLYAGSSENTAYATSRNITMQNTIGSESLAMSNHIKGKHGYGGIFGGTYASFYHNLLAHHDSRSPRLDRELGSTDIRNNVIYDWGQTNSAYGGEPYSVNNVTQIPSNVNYADNYYKSGPSTKDAISGRIFDVSNPEKIQPYSRFYFNNNYVYGHSDITENNMLGINNIDMADLLDTPVDMGEYSVPEQTPQEAYDEILASAGASLPKRDAVDARIVGDTLYGTGRIINSPDEVGGYIPSDTQYRTFEIPQEWKDENGMENAAETDIVQSGAWSGYTWIEAYVNDWTQNQPLPTNPEITVVSPTIASSEQTVNGETVQNGNWTVITEDKPLEYSARTTAKGGNEVVKMELYDRSKLIKSYEGNEIGDSIYLQEGTHYLTCRAYNSIGEKTQSTTSIVYVKSTHPSGSWEYAQIGNGAFGSEGGASMDENGIYTLFSSGRVSASGSDRCGFMYKPVTGDFDMTVKIEEIPKFENNQHSGLMVRETMGVTSKMALLADGWQKYGENVSVFMRKKSGMAVTSQWFENSDGNEIKNDSSYDTSSSSHRLPEYMRIQRSGNVLTFSLSDSGTDFTDNPRQPMSVEFDSLADTLLVGIANDSAQGIPTKEYLSMARYGELTLNGERDNPEDFKESYIKNENGKITAHTVDDALLYRVDYDVEGRMVNAVSQSMEDGSYTTDTAAENRKFMLWDSTLKPMCEFAQ